MEELYTNPTFKTILFYGSLAIFGFLALVIIVKIVGKNKGHKNQHAEVKNSDIQRLFNSSNENKETKGEGMGKKPFPEMKEEYDVENNFFRKNKYKDFDL